MNVNELLVSLQTMFDKGDYEQLKEQAEDFLDENEGNAALFILLAKTSAANGDIADTQYYCLEAKTAAPESTEPLFLLAALKMKLNDLLGAQHYLESILAKEPENARAMALLGDILYSEDMFDGAIEQYTKALEGTAKEQLNHKEYVAVIYKATVANFTNKAFEAALNILDRFAPSQFEESLTLAKRSIYVGMGPDKMEDVVACVELLYANVPTNPDYILELVQYVEDAGDNERIIDLIQKCLSLELSPQQQTTALRTRAEAFANLNQTKEALSDYTTLLAIAEGWFDCQRSAELKETLGDLKGAIQDITKAIKLIGEPYAPLIAHRAKLFFKGGLTEKAIADFTSLLSLPDGEDDADTYYNLGVAYNKLGERSNAVKMLIKAEMLGHEKAGELLMKSFSEHLINARQKIGAKFLEAFRPEFERNKRSPILTKAFGKLWIPNMRKFLMSNEAEISIYPSSIIKQMLGDAEKDMLLITPEGLLLFEGTEEPIEAYYRVDVESEHAILLELQPTKGGAGFNMRISFHEDNLLLNYPVGEADVPAKYFIPASEVNDSQKERLKTKKINIPYMEAIESSISNILGE